MSNNSGSVLQGVILTLLVISVYLLYSYNKELAVQRTPEQTAQLEQQITVKKNIEIMKAEQEKVVRESLIALDWSESINLDLFISKVIATRAYLFLLAPMILISLISFMQRTMKPT